MPHKSMRSHVAFKACLCLSEVFLPRVQGPHPLVLVGFGIVEVLGPLVPIIHQCDGISRLPIATNFSDCTSHHLHHPRVVHRGVVTKHPLGEVVANPHPQDDKENRIGRHEDREVIEDLEVGILHLHQSRVGLVLDVVDVHASHHRLHRQGRDHLGHVRRKGDLKSFSTICEGVQHHVAHHFHAFGHSFLSQLLIEFHFSHGCIAFDGPLVENHAHQVHEESSSHTTQFLCAHICRIHQCRDCPLSHCQGILLDLLLKPQMLGVDVVESTNSLPLTEGTTTA